MSLSGNFYYAMARVVMALELEATTMTMTNLQPPPRLAVVATITCMVSLKCKNTVHLVESD
jgi:hypothetical protein